MVDKIAEKMCNYFKKYKFRFEDGIYFLSDPKEKENFENLYYKVRKEEGRFFTDELVKNLPLMPKESIFKGEWDLRRRNLSIVKQELLNSQKNSVILDVGSGNGWTCNFLSKYLTDSSFFAIDLNYEELIQGRRLFSHENLYFFYGDILEVNFPDNSVDIILLGSSIQYFPNLKKIIDKMMGFLTEDGFILIFDSKFYDSGHEIQTARLNSEKYYHTLNMPEMAKHYFHHQLEDLLSLNYQILYNPNSLLNKLISKFTIKSPFYIIKIEKRKN